MFYEMENINIFVSLAFMCRAFLILQPLTSKIIKYINIANHFKSRVLLNN